MNCHEATLRNLAEEDLYLVREWRNHPDIRRYMYTRHVIGEEEHQNWFSRSQSDPNYYPLLAELDSKPFAFVSFRVVDIAARYGEWGFYLAPDAKPGSGQELGAAALHYAFNDLNLVKLYGEALACNIRSISFHERLGFTREEQPQDQHFDGCNYSDIVRFGLLRSDWQSYGRGSV